jgi:cytochrome c-type biogenesis protein CcmH/NrfG
VVDSVRSTVDRSPTRPDLWHLLSEIYRGFGKRQEALRALETSLRLDMANVEAWLSLVSMADESGDSAFIQDTIEAMDKLFPEHPKVRDLRERYLRPLAFSESESNLALAVEPCGSETVAG